jgi:hypothetical protein
VFIQSQPSLLTTRGHDGGPKLGGGHARSPGRLVAGAALHSGFPPAERAIPLVRVGSHSYYAI